MRLLGTGAVKCCGGNGYGQLGDGTATSRLRPVSVVGLISGVTRISAYMDASCAVQNTALKCWGVDTASTLWGTGTVKNRTTPATLAGFTSGVAQVGIGSENYCVRTTLGAVRCWGYNYTGQLGDGTTVDRASAVTVSGMGSGVTALGTGFIHSCAVQSGALKCWGNNQWGKLGDGTTTTRTTPRSVLGLTSLVTAVDADEGVTCAIQSGYVKCWGQTYLGNGLTPSSVTPVAVQMA